MAYIYDNFPTRFQNTKSFTDLSIHLKHKIWRMSSYHVESGVVHHTTPLLSFLLVHIHPWPGRCPSSHLLRYDLVQSFGPEVVGTWCNESGCIVDCRHQNGNWVCFCCSISVFMSIFVDPDVCFRFLLLFFSSRF